MRADLRRQGIAVSRVRKERQLFKSQGKVTAEDIALFARQLATMLTAGIPMVQASKSSAWATISRRCRS
jgi:type IV pilus assembly protein PilC